MSIKAALDKTGLPERLDGFAKGSYTISRRQFPRAFVAGLAGVILMYIGVAGMISANAPWQVRGDTRQHIDYIWRLYNGELPKRTDGVTYPPLVQAAGVYKPESASKNPPLFYAIHAPFVGPFLNKGELNKAIAVGRVLNIVLGILCILALSWAGWLFGGRRRWLLALSTPAMSVLVFRFTRLNVDYALDVLVVLFATLSMALSYKLLKHGPTRKYLGLITLVSIAGMLTKVSFLIFLVTNLLAVFLAYLLKPKKIKREDIVRAIVVPAVMLIVVIAASGWYYYIRDYKISGSWINAASSRVPNARSIHSLKEIIKGSRLWSLLFGNYVRNIALSTLLTGFALSGVLAAAGSGYKKIIRDRPMLLAIGLMTLAFLATFAAQAKFAMHGGSINFRYMLPAILPLGLLLSYGLLELKWTRGLLVAFTAFLMGILSIGAYADHSVRYFGSAFANRFFGGVFAASHLNGVNPIITSLLILSFLIGSGLLALGLYKLSGPAEKA